MSTQDLIKELEKTDNLIPKDVLEEFNKNHKAIFEVANELQKIMDQNRALLEKSYRLQKNYIELVNYLYSLKLTKEKPKQDEKIFSDKFIDEVLSLPEPA